MTFDEWWNSLTTRQQAQRQKETAKEIWVAATKSENEACAQINDAPHFKIVVRNELKRRADAIRARIKS